MATRREVSSWVRAMAVCQVGALLLLGHLTGCAQATSPPLAKADQSATKTDRRNPAVEKTGAKQAAKPALAGPKPLKASNVVALKKLVGKQVAVFGRVDRTASSRSGTEFLNFAASELSVVCFKEDVAKFRQGKPAVLYKNKDVKVSGKLELYKGKLQIKLREPSQISLYKAAATGGSGKPPRTVELKQVGKDVWLSPAGLRYRGKDPAGLTRVEHILRHTKDIPDRQGSHGVFDGGKGAAFAVIDDAWLQAKKKKLRAKVEGDRSTYLVPLGRRVGYLGGSTGKQRRNPPLSRVFIVYETGTTNIITAFPR